MLPDGPFPLQGIHVLVVNGDFQEQLLYTLSLRRYGAEVTAVSSAEQAIGALTASPYDILICDSALPGGEAFSLIRDVRALAPLQGGHIPAITVTGWSGEADRLKAIAAGFSMHLSKPVALARLAAVTAGLVDGCRSQSASHLREPRRSAVL
jgi:two-component system CheB/CheR fusion protein